MELTQLLSLSSLLTINVKNSQTLWKHPCFLVINISAVRVLAIKSKNGSILKPTLWIFKQTSESHGQNKSVYECSLRSPHQCMYPCRNQDHRVNSPQSVAIIWEGLYPGDRTQDTSLLSHLLGHMQTLGLIVRFMWIIFQNILRMNLMIRKIWEDYFEGKSINWKIWSQNKSYRVLK